MKQIRKQTRSDLKISFSPAAQTGFHFKKFTKLKNNKIQNGSLVNFEHKI